MGASHSLESDTPADEQAERPSTASLAGPSTTAYDDGAGVHPRSVASGQPPAKRARLASTDLSDRHIRLCAQDAIFAVQRRVVGLQMVDRLTPQHELVTFPPSIESADLEAAGNAVVRYCSSVGVKHAGEIGYIFGTRNSHLLFRWVARARKAAQKG